MTTITAVLPTYNRAPILARALTSVFAQTRQPDEVIVVDDASTDDTADVIRRFPRARLLRLETNGGAARARNAGVRAAHSDLIAFIDSDDAWVAHKLASQLERMQAARDIAMLCSGITVHERSGKSAHHGFEFYSPPDGWTFSELQTYPFSTSTWLIRKQAFVEIGMFDETLANCEDLDFCARIAPRYRVEVLPGSLTVKYNQNDSINADLRRTAESYAVLFERHAALWARSPAAMTLALQRLGHMHIRAGDLRGGRAALLRAARLQRARPAAWLLAMSTLLGQRVYMRARRVLARP